MHAMTIALDSISAMEDKSIAKDSMQFRLRAQKISPESDLKPSSISGSQESLQAPKGGR